LSWADPGRIVIRCCLTNRARLIGFCHYLALGLIAPPAPTANPGANINTAASLRSFNYMINHICKPIQSRRLHLPDQIARCKMGTEHRLRLTLLAREPSCPAAAAARTASAAWSPGATPSGSVPAGTGRSALALMTRTRSPSVVHSITWSVRSSKYDSMCRIEPE
jgi:hypothetical protein